MDKLYTLDNPKEIELPQTLNGVVLFLGYSKNVKVIPILLKYSKGFASVQLDRAMANMGTAIIKPYMEEITNEEKHNKEKAIGMKMGAMCVFEELYKNNNIKIDEPSRVIIKKLVVDSLGDKNDFLRSTASEVAGSLGDKDLIPLLEKIAKEDPYMESRTIGDGSKKNPHRREKYYQTRELAQESIKKIKLSLKGK